MTLNNKMYLEIEYQLISVFSHSGNIEFRERQKIIMMIIQLCLNISGYMFHWKPQHKYQLDATSHKNLISLLAQN
jgi:hypothetical protein